MFGNSQQISKKTQVSEKTQFSKKKTQHSQQNAQTFFQLKDF